MTIGIYETTADKERQNKHFLSGSESACLVKYCTDCSVVHVMLFAREGDDVPVWTIDLSPTFIDQFLPLILAARMQLGSSDQSSDTAPRHTH